MREKNGNKLKKLHPLQPMDSLRPETDAAFGVYKTYLDDIFRDRSRRNIALIGDRGSGKSSVILSYNRLVSPRKQYLYVSLADFEERDIAASNRKVNNKNKSEDTVQNLTQKRLEYSLMCQILARCSEKDLRGSSLQRIPAERSLYQRSRSWSSCIRNWFTQCLIPMLYVLTFAGLIFALVFEDRFGAFLKSYGKDTLERVRIHGYAYIATFVLLAIGLVYLRRKRWFRAFKLSKLTLKADKAEAELMPSDEKYCLDHFKFELIHILNRLSNDIGCTVVFEDMERLNEQMRFEILLKLRELNTLTNTFRMSYNKSVKPIRFVYVLDDSLFGWENRVKFFDTILPMVPSFNYTCSNELLRKGFAQYHIPISEEPIASTIRDISRFVTDYRCALAIVNEYLVLRDLAVAHDAPPMVKRRRSLLRWRFKTDSPVQIDVMASNSILLLAVCKTIFPDCYMSFLLKKPPAAKVKAPKDELCTYLWDRVDEIISAANRVGYPKQDILSEKLQQLTCGDIDERLRLADYHFSDEEKQALRGHPQLLECFETELIPYVALHYAKILFINSDDVLDHLEDVKKSGRNSQRILENYLEAMETMAQYPISDPQRAAKLFIQWVKSSKFSAPDDSDWAFKWNTIWNNTLGPRLAEILLPIADTLPDDILKQKMVDRTLEEHIQYCQQNQNPV